MFMKNSKITAFAASLLLCGGVAASAADASLPDQRRDIIDVRYISAVHQPTGCAAKVMLVDGVFTRGYIADPKCLPKGVNYREAPGLPWDFTLVK